MDVVYSISEAARMTNMTAETLRHYDRIGLVRPSRKDVLTKYRYYTSQDIVRLNTVHALAQMDLSLCEIREVLEYSDLTRIISFLERAEQRADEKIAELEYGKTKIRLARADYERKLLAHQRNQEVYTAALQQRLILLSDTMEKPTLDNLWSYLGHFYNQLSPEAREAYEFEDLAGIYTEGGVSRLFAVCRRYADPAGLKILPEGTYLCADCTEETRARKLDELMRLAREQYHVEPAFTVQIVIVTGILQWSYQLQILLWERQ